MTHFGKLIWKEMAKHAGEEGIINVMEYFSDSVLPLGFKTLQRRLNDDNWTLAELIDLQQTLKSDALHNFLITKFNEAKK